MTREETKKAIEVMQAYLDGEEIEVLRSLDSDWEKNSYPQWDWDSYTYRIKPQPIKVTEEEKDEMKNLLWIKNKRSGKLSFTRQWGLDKDYFYILNPNTMEWEDWSEDTDTLRHHYNGGQP